MGRQQQQQQQMEGEAERLFVNPLAAHPLPEADEQQQPSGRGCGGEFQAHLRKVTASLLDILDHMNAQPAADAPAAPAASSSSGSSPASSSGSSRGEAVGGGWSAGEEGCC